MIKIAHECPKSIFNSVQRITDYDYFLVHLFEEDSEYLELAKASVAAGRETILDNSIFELGEAFDMQKFADWVNEIKPTYYIVPDVLDDFVGTIANMKRWCSEFKDKIDPSCKMMAVVQGKTYAEFKECYKFMDKKAKADKIAFPFDSKLYENVVPYKNKLVSWMMGRRVVLSQMVRDNIINRNKPAHLLGAGLIEEFKYYRGEHFNWIDSVDTSSPVVYGIESGLYDSKLGNDWKPSTKLYTLINKDLSPLQEDTVMQNIMTFRCFCNTEWLKEGKN